MKLQQVAIALTVLNLMIMMFILGYVRPATAGSSGQILRGRGLEIVDAAGRIRASISVHPPTRVDGKDYPETVLLRLTDPKSGPVVKLTAAENGSALGLSDDSEKGGVQIYARETGSFLKVVSKDGREQVIKP